MNFYLRVLLSLTILFPAIIGIIRFKKINDAYYPFIIYIWVGAINELLSVILLIWRYSNIINLNVYLLIEAMLLMWQFTLWRFFGKSKILRKLLYAALLSFWLTENFLLYSITRYDSYFTIFYSTIFTFISISSINQLIVTERKSLLQNPKFIICAAFVIYFTIVILSEVFWLYGVSQSVAFSNYVISISNITNFIAIILYTLAILWMPIKHRFTLPSS